MSALTSRSLLSDDEKILLQRLRDISQQDKNELQHTAKELEKLTAELTTFQQRNESLKEDLAKAEDTIDELKEQVTWLATFRACII